MQQNGINIHLTGFLSLLIIFKYFMSDSFRRKSGGSCIPAHHDVEKSLSFVPRGGNISGKWAFSIVNFLKKVHNLNESRV
jgi:hypothetical protein